MNQLPSPADALNLLILVCTYNERANLPELFARIGAVRPNSPILVVDDNSPDGTSDWVREFATTETRVNLIQRSGKLGLGSAIRDGMQYAFDHGFDWILNLDADLSHDPKVIADMLRHTEDADLVIGSRYVPGGGMVGCSWRRKLMSRCANRYAQWVAGWNIKDCSSAYRLYRASMLQQLPLQSMLGKGYGFLEEILWHIIDSGARIVETPIVYEERKKGQSKISIREMFSTISALHRVAGLKKRIK